MVVLWPWNRMNGEDELRGQEKIQNTEDVRDSITLIKSFT